MKKVFKIMAFIEDTTAFLICTALFIYVASEPVGEYTFNEFLFRLCALLCIYLLAKFEGGDE